MAFENGVLTTSLPATADLDAHQYKFIKSVSGVATVCGAADVATGVLQNDPVAGGTAGVMVYGISRVLAGAAVAEGVKVTPDADGKAVLATTGQAAAGITLEAAAAADDLIAVLLTPGGQAE